MLGGSQEAEIGGYRAHPSAAGHYGGQYSSLYSSALSSSQQVSGFHLIFSTRISSNFYIIISFQLKSLISSIFGLVTWI